MKILLKVFAASAVIAIAGAVTSCSDDDKVVPVSVPVSVEMPADMGTLTPANQQFVFTNVTDASQSVFTDASAISVVPGLYNIEYTADVELHDGVKATLRANASNVTIADATTPIKLTAYVNIAGNDLVISELFFTGTLSPNGKNYIGDQYIKLYNNTDHVIYADGITIFESEFLTSNKYSDLEPDIMADAVTVDALYTIPGNGTEHPVQPGQYITIADIAIDHRTANANSFDLSNADFEWYDESSVPSVTDIDSPAPNLEKLYCYTRTIFLLHKQGYKGYGIARLPQNGQEYLDNNSYTYNYNIVTSTGTYPMSSNAYKIDNQYIKDFVTISVSGKYQWNVTAPSIDCGWTYCHQESGDKSAYFKAVRRKVQTITEDGRVILKDTNNSADDFNAAVVPSEVEAQGTAINVNGDKAGQVTLDGVTVAK